MTSRGRIYGKSQPFTLDEARIVLGFDPAGHDDAVLAFIKTRRLRVPTTVRTIYYRDEDCYRVVVCAGDKELEIVGIFTAGGKIGRLEAEMAADQAAFERLLPTSWIDLP